MKTELDTAGGEEIGGGGEVVVVGAERSKRSPMLEEDAWTGFEGAGAGADKAPEGDAKDPKSPKPLLEGFFWCEGAAGWPGLASKKLPPLKALKELLLGGGALLEDALPKLAKGSAAAGLELVVFPILKLLNASLKPPNEPGCWSPGELMPPNEPCD